MRISCPLDQESNPTQLDIPEDMHTITQSLRSMYLSRITETDPKSNMFQANGSKPKIEIAFEKHEMHEEWLTFLAPHRHSTQRSGYPPTMATACRRTYARVRHAPARVRRRKKEMAGFA
ncbi:hypothetical protein N7G274_006669 [Stereocaulon virgatum]|uniref:Uncharacterized protein n=1 Tax=Stereocaulon virgatum TaxID=373712 RepID=A0ABR4A5I2_9LECA